MHKSAIIDTLRPSLISRCPQVLSLNKMGKKSSGAASWVLNTVSHIQILGLGTDIGDGVPSVLLFFDKRRYLFNVGEGFQRFATQHQVNFKYLTDVLLTRNSSDAAGGLPGLCLNLSDALGGFKDSINRLDFYGPRGVADLQHAVHQYVNSTAIHVEGHACTADSHPAHEAHTAGSQEAPVVLRREEVVISAVQLMPERAEAEEEPRMDTAANANGTLNPGSGASALAEQEWPNKRQKVASTSFLKNNEAPSLAEDGPACCYICDLADTPGRFQPEKAKALGVPMGPLFGRLKGGQTVTLPNGNTVHPADVLEASVRGARIVIADCPSRAHLPSLLGATALHGSSTGAKHAGHGNAGPALSASGGSGSSSARDLYVIHLADAQVLGLPEYQMWMKAFPEGTVHIVAAAKKGCPVLESSAELQAQLNALAPQFFPLHQHQFSAVLEAQGLKIVPGDNMLKIHLRPKRDDPLDYRDTRPVSDASAVQSRLREAHPKVFEALDLPEGKRDSLHINIPSCIQAADRETLEVLFLGTGAALPSKYRNVTATYLNMFDKGGMLLDCGEGTYGQLRRRYGKAIDGIIAGMKCIWISHIHADHHAGLGRILAVRTKLLGRSAPPLLVIAPRPFQRVLTAVHRLEPMAFRYVDCACTTASYPQGAEASAGRSAVLAAQDSLGLTRLESFPVQHCAHAFGIVLENQSAWKVAVSGDTRPCPAVVEAAKDSTLLIHEATFESSRNDATGELEFEQEALTKRHSMTHEAVQTGEQAGAYRTVLTHFSQRYPKIPVVDSTFLESTCIAFDLMSVNLKDLPSLPGIIPALQLLFQEGLAGDGAKEPGVEAPNANTK